MTKGSGGKGGSVVGSHKKKERSELLVSVLAQRRGNRPLDRAPGASGQEASWKSGVCFKNLLQGRSSPLVAKIGKTGLPGARAKGGDPTGPRTIERLAR